jgi:DNA-binding GntR family transcriptional regulator
MVSYLSPSIEDKGDIVYDELLEVIFRYTVKDGAAHLKHKTIEAATGKSCVTVRRTFRKLVNLTIIEKIHYIRPLMSDPRAYIYIISPFHD